ncbi:morphogenetic protein associated with SpoVID [Gracilibacillus halotolerans]|uniref:Morphogenetic protein associated with SpoVID n=1 Tax=Gracilibacillus halotolerans TaxID=74386 RepID=A0A841RD87_9BACI|nr:morphogenetic protein associated with SpoVID [Gracilibacillus halotolerans]
MKIHVVQDNETLWTISQKYGVSLDAIIAANTQIANPDMIMPGMKIRIPGDSSSKQHQQQQQQSLPKKQQQVQQQQIQQPQPSQKDKKQWLPNIKEDDDKKWESLKKEMPSLPLTFHTKEPIIPPKEPKFPPKEQKLPPKDKTYEMEALWQQQDTYLKPAPSMKQPKEPKTFKTDNLPSTPTPQTPSYNLPATPTPSYSQSVTETPKPTSQTSPTSYQPSQAQPQLAMQQPHVHQPIYQSDGCGPQGNNQVMWPQHQQTPNMHYPGCPPNPYDYMSQNLSPYGHGGWNPNMMTGLQQPTQSFGSPSANPGQMMPMQGYGSMNPMASPYSMNQPYYQQPYSSAPNLNDCGCGSRDEQ